MYRAQNFCILLSGMAHSSHETEAFRELPPQAETLFWDVDLTQLDPHKHAQFVIVRLLTLGRPEHIRWVLQQYSRQEMIHAIRTSRTLDPKTANFWALYFDIPREQIRCFRTS